MKIDLDKYNVDNELVESIEILDEMPDLGEKENSENNVFDYFGRPCMIVSSYEEFIREIMEELESRSDHDSDSDSEDPDSKFSIEKMHEKLNNIKHIYTIIDYPLTKSSIFKFTWKQDVTYGMVLYAYTVAYQLTYKIEEEDDEDPGYIPGMFNRATSKGRFGIWGHDIEDLVYNGSSEINYYHDSISCNFDCDS